MRKYLLLFSLSFIIALSTSSNAQTVRAGLQFDGTNDRVRVPHFNGLDLGTGAFTFEVWIQADTGQAYNPHILHKKDTAVNATGFSMVITDRGKFLFEVAGGGYSTGFGFGSGSDLRDGDCHHLAAHRDVSGASDTIRLFIDGNLMKKSVEAIPSADISRPEDMFIGWTSGGFGKEDWPFHGMIKELRIWSVARTETQLMNNMDKFLKGNESGLVGYWRMNDNSGTTVKDYGPSKANGTLQSGSGAPTWDEFCDVIDDVLPSGISEIDERTAGVYPNPVVTDMNFKLNANQRIRSLRIFNAMGALVRTEIQPENRIDVSELKSGMYFYELQLNDNTVVKDQFVKE